MKLAVIFGALLLLQGLPTMTHWLQEKNFPISYYPEEYQYIKEQTSSNDILVGSGRLGWFSKRKVVTPIFRKDFETIVPILEKDYFSPQGIYLEAEVDRKGQRVPPILQEEIPGFALKKRFVSENLYFERKK